MIIPNRLRNVIYQWKHEADYFYPIVVGQLNMRGELILCTKFPGILIGRGGELSKKYLDEIKKVPEYHRIECIKWIEIDGIIV